MSLHSQILAATTVREVELIKELDCLKNGIRILVSSVVDANLELANGRIKNLVRVMETDAVIGGLHEEVNDWVETAIYEYERAETQLQWTVTFFGLLFIVAQQWLLAL